MVLFKNDNLLQDEFRISTPYIRVIRFTNFGEVSIQGTRHIEVLKLWLSLHHIGRKGCMNNLSTKVINW